MNSPSTTQGPARILVRGVNWLGDAVMTTPALQRLREAHPASHITLLTHAKLAELWQHHPSLDALRTFADGAGVFEVARQLRPEKFDLALVLPNSPRSALEVFLARIPRRVGGARPWRNLFLTDRVTPRADAAAMRKKSVAAIKRLIARPSGLAAPGFSIASHHMHHYLHLVAALGGNPEPLAPRLAVTEQEVLEFKKRFGLLPETAEGRPWFGLNPGAEYGPAKRWPASRFVAAATELQGRTGCRWLILGGKSEIGLADGIAAGIAGSVLNLAGRTGLRELCAALKTCAVVLTNDSGPMHVAAALGTPVVALFGSTSPELTGPGLPGTNSHALLRSLAPCAPCFRRECPIDLRCLHGITVESVVTAVLEKTQNHRPSRAQTKPRL